MYLEIGLLDHRVCVFSVSQDSVFAIQNGYTNLHSHPLFNCHLCDTIPKPFSNLGSPLWIHLCWLLFLCNTQTRTWLSSRCPTIVDGLFPNSAQVEQLHHLVVYAGIKNWTAIILYLGNRVLKIAVALYMFYLNFTHFFAYHISFFILPFPLMNVIPPRWITLGLSMLLICIGPRDITLCPTTRHLSDLPVCSLDSSFYHLENPRGLCQLFSFILYL